MRRRPGFHVENRRELVVDDVIGHGWAAVGVELFPGV